MRFWPGKLDFAQLAAIAFRTVSGNPGTPPVPRTSAVFGGAGDGCV
jgi:hypothetical protein